MSLNRMIPAARRAVGWLLCGVVLAGIPALCEESASGAAPAKKSSKTADKTADSEPHVSILRHFSFGGRFSYVPKNLMRNRTDIDYTTGTTPVNTTFTTTTQSHRLGAGPSIEFAYNKRFLVSTDLLYHRFGYQIITTKVVNPNLSTSKTTTTTEQTRANFWDVPVLLHVSHLPLPHVPSKFFVSGGGVFRFVKSIRTDTGTTYPDATTSYSAAPKAAQNTTLTGLAGGAGIRFRDDFGIKMTIEGRFTRWSKQVFTMPGPVSPYELDVLVGFTF